MAGSPSRNQDILWVALRDDDLETARELVEVDPELFYRLNRSGQAPVWWILTQSYSRSTVDFILNQIQWERFRFRFHREYREFIPKLRSREYLIQRGLEIYPPAILELVNSHSLPHFISDIIRNYQEITIRAIFRALEPIQERGFKFNLNQSFDLLRPFEDLHVSDRNQKMALLLQFAPTIAAAIDCGVIASRRLNNYLSRTSTRAVDWEPLDMMISCHGSEIQTQIYGLTKDEIIQHRTRIYFRRSLLEMLVLFL